MSKATPSYRLDSKIGGEMVPHIKIEDKLYELARAPNKCLRLMPCPMKRKASGLQYCIPCLATGTGKLDFRALKAQAIGIAVTALS
jgi:hypothetical protein